MLAWESLSQGMPDWVGMDELEKTLAADISEGLDQALLQLPEGPERTAIYNARKTFFQHQKLQTTLILANVPITESREIWKKRLVEWESLLQAKLNAEKTYAEVLEAGISQLQHWAMNPVLRSGLLYASHDLLAQLDGFAQADSVTTGKKKRKTAMTLLQYLCRTMYKTSPFSVFTTLSVQSFSGESKETPGQWFTSRSTVTPNVALLPFIYEVLLKDPVFTGNLRVLLNPSIRKNVDGYYSWLYFDGEQEAFQQMPVQPLLDFLLNYLTAPGRKISAIQLTALLVAETEGTAESVEAWLNRLLDIGFLEYEMPEKGLSSGWCSSLYQYLGFQTASPLSIEVAFLLQWLRTTARTLPFQTPDMVLAAQRTAKDQLTQLLHKYGVDTPAIPTEQVFYEDVFQDYPAWISQEEWLSIQKDLFSCWHDKSAHHLPEFRASLVSFARERMKKGGTMPFLDFCQAYIQAGTMPQSKIFEKRFDGKVGVVIQVYQQDGQCKAVVNGMYAGGGRMFSRWLGQFPPEESIELKDWMQTRMDDTAPYPFPGWANVHFQPVLVNGRIDVPESRIPETQAIWQISLKDLEVTLDQEGIPKLWDPNRACTTRINDLGLESPELLPPVRRILWYLGMPYVSLDGMLPDKMLWEDKGDIHYKERISHGRLVLSRATWFLAEEQWRIFFPKGQSEVEGIRKWILQCHVWGVPRYFFGKFSAGRDKPQFYDQKSPVSMSLFFRNLQKGRGGLTITEMLPIPEQCPAGRAQEYILEWDSTMSE